MKSVPLMFACGLVVLAGAAVGEDAPKTTHDFTEKAEVGTQTETKCHLVIKGTVKIDNREESVIGQALLVYPEKVLAVNADGTASKVARYYQDARAKFVIGKLEEPRMLRDALRLMIGDQGKSSLELWSPVGTLNSDERELIEDVLDTTKITGLLPKKPTSVGQSWTPEPMYILALAGFKYFVNSTIQGKLEKVDDDKAVLTFTGEASGLSHGTEVTARVSAQMIYDLKKQFVEKLVWKQRDSRGPSPINPQGEFEVVITIDRQKANSDHLAPDKLMAITTEASPVNQLLVLTDPLQRFRFYHDRDWHITLLNEDRAVLRRMVNGEFVGQLNITPVTTQAGPSKFTPEQLQAMIEQTAGTKINEIIRTDMVPTEGEYTLQALIAKGTSGKVELTQRHYLATSKGGKQFIFSFLIEPKHEAKFGQKDIDIVGTLEFAASAASRPATDAKK